jgi:hypothetical protein
MLQYSYLVLSLSIAVFLFNICDLSSWQLVTIPKLMEKYVEIIYFDVNTAINLIFTTKFNDSSILITIISCDYLNLSLADEHGDVTIPTQVI